jgi:putative membrane protein
MPSDEPSAGGVPTNPSTDRQATSDQPRWLHPTSFIFDVLSHVRSYVVPFLLALFGAAQDDLFWQYMALIIFISSLIQTLLHYITLRYRIAGADLVINSGLIFRRVRTIPIRKIQNLDLIQNPLHRLFRVAEVRVETASGAEADAILRVLSLRDVDLLRAELFPERAASSIPSAVVSGEPSSLSDQDHSGIAEGVGANPAKESARIEELLRVPFRWLALAGLASDRGLLLVGVAIGAMFQFNDRWYRDETIWRAITKYANTWTTVIIGLVAALLLLKLLSIGWFTLRFFDYRLTRIGNDLRLSSGLFTKISATIPRQRIQFISIHRPLLFRWTHFATIKLETAGGWSNDGEGGTTGATRSWFVPVVPATEVPRLLGELRPGLDWNEQSQAWQPVSRRASARLMRIAILTALLMTVAAGVMSWPWGWFSALVFIPAMVAWAIKKGRSHSYSRTPFGLAYRSGLVTRKLSLTFYERIQSVSLNQTPFDRRWKMATLTVDTAAAGPAEHRISIPYLEESFAREEFDQLRQLIARENPEANRSSQVMLTQPALPAQLPAVAAS